MRAKSTATGINSRSRWNNASRVTAALIPGFLLTNTSGVLISFLIPGEKFTGIAWATLLSFVLYAMIVMWVFHTPKLKTVWLTLVGGIVLTSLTSWGLFTLDSTL